MEKLDSRSAIIRTLAIDSVKGVQFKNNVPKNLVKYLTLRNTIEEYNSKVHNIFPKTDASMPETGDAGLSETTIMFRTSPLGVPFGLPLDEDSESFEYNIIGSRGVGIKGMKILLEKFRDVCRSKVWVYDFLEPLKCTGKREILQSLAHYEPLCIANITATRELEESNVPSWWSNLYSINSKLNRHCGVYGTIYDNTCVDVYTAYTDDVENISQEYETLFPNDDFLGFLDPVFTPASEAAGSKRLLSRGCEVRVQSRSILDRVEEILGLLKPKKGSEYRFHWYGIIAKISESSYCRLIDFIVNHNTSKVTFTVLEDLKLISMNTFSGGVVRRQFVDWDYSECLDQPSLGNFTRNTLWVDSTNFNKRETFPEDLAVPREQNPEEFTSILMAFFPYIYVDKSPRPLLSITMSLQAMCHPGIASSCWCVPKHSFNHVVRTPLLHETMECIKSEDKDYPISLPGCPLVTVFMNDNYCYEDSIVISRQIVDEGWLDHYAVLSHPLPFGEEDPIPMTDVDTENSWWRPTCGGKTLYVGITRDGNKYVRTLLDTISVQVGDKLATPHGQKFIISEIRDPEDMPLLSCRRSGRRFRAQVIMSVSSVYNRETFGQLYEGFRGAEVCDVFDFNPLTNEEYTVIDPLCRDLSSMDELECDYLGTVNDPLESMSDLSVKIGALNYGICLFWQLTILVRDKQHYISKIPRGLSNAKGRLKGAGVRFGDMEMLSASMAGMFQFISDTVDGSDTVVFQVCTKCNRQQTLCDCEEANETVSMITRYPTLKLDTMLATISLNFDGGVPRAFKYY